MTTLHLTLKKKWFDMIASGVKKEEYREYKDYWMRRFFDFTTDSGLKHFDIIQFRNGDSNDAATIRIECKGLMLREPKPEWSDNAKGQHFVIKLGKILK